MKIKKVIWIIIQAVIPAVILIFLFNRMSVDQTFAIFKNSLRRYDLIVLAFVVYLAAIFSSFLRWHILNRIQGFQVSIMESCRLAFYGFLCRIVPLGGYVTGDVFRIWRLAKSEPGKEPEAVASIVADRILSLYSLFMTAAIIIVMMNSGSLNGPFVQSMVKTSLLIFVTMTIFLFFFLILDHSQNRLVSSVLSRIPWIGMKLVETVQAISKFRGHLWELSGALLLSLTTDVLFGIMIYLIALGLFTGIPSFGAHLFITQIGFASGMIPVVIGPFELIFSQFYQDFAQFEYLTGSSSHGVLVVFVYRCFPPLLTILGLSLLGWKLKAIYELFQKAKKTETIESSCSDQSTGT